MDVKKVQFQRFREGHRSAEELRDEARRLVDEAKQKADGIARQAYEQGFAQGEQAGFKIGMAKAQPNVEGIAALIEELNRLLLTTLESMEPEIVRLVQAVAEKVIHTTIAADSEVMTRVINAAVAEADKNWEATVRLNPTDYETIQRHPEAVARLAEARRVKLVADPSLPGGGCIVETPTGYVDASVKRAIDAVFKFEET
jgi:flagellar assembly protein FliH